MPASATPLWRIASGRVALLSTTHQEINAGRDEVLECVLVRSDNEAVVVNLDIEPIEKPETVPWIDPIHKG